MTLIAKNKVKPLKLDFGSGIKTIDSYWEDLLPSSYMIIDSVTDTTMFLPPECPAPNICRDSYLFNIAKWANTGKEESILSALFTTTKSADLSAACDTTVHTWKEVFPGLKFNICPVAVGGTMFNCVVFTITKNMVENPLTFWLLTDDLRRSCTNKCKYNPEDAGHTTVKYIDLVTRLRRRDFYTPAANRSAPQCLIPSKYADSAAGSYHCRSPLEYLERIAYVNSILAAVTINRVKYAPFIKTAYYMCHYLEKISLQIRHSLPDYIINTSVLEWAGGVYNALNLLDKPGSK